MVFVRLIGLSFSKQKSFKDNWWRIRDLNPGPKDYDSSALTTELIRHTETKHFLRLRYGLSRLNTAYGNFDVAISAARNRDNMPSDFKMLTHKFASHSRDKSPCLM